SFFSGYMRSRILIVFFLVQGSDKKEVARPRPYRRGLRSRLINAEGEAMAAAALGDASDIMMAHPLALQLRNLQSLVDIAVDKNSTVIFPAPLMTTIAELGSFLAGEKAASLRSAPSPQDEEPMLATTVNGVSDPKQGHSPTKATWAN
ncbi:MAG: SPFH domain-containing protein, partial [Ferrimicrobium sp.]